MHLRCKTSYTVHCAATRCASPILNNKTGSLVGSALPLFAASNEVGCEQHMSQRENALQNEDCLQRALSQTHSQHRFVTTVNLHREADARRQTSRQPCHVTSAPSLLCGNSASGITAQSLENSQAPLKRPSATTHADRIQQQSRHWPMTSVLRKVKQ